MEELAHNFGSQVIFLHVVELPLVYTRIQGESSVNIEELTIEAMTHKAESNLAGLVGEFRENNIESKAIVKEGSIAHTIMEIAEREKIDLISMASHGRSGLSRVYYGSVAASVLHLVDRPLLLIRAEGKG